MQIGAFTLDFSEPLHVAAAGIMGGSAVLILLVLWSVLAARRAAASAAPLTDRIEALGRVVEGLGHGQHQLLGGLTQVTEAQAASQARLMQIVETRLAEVSHRMGESLGQSATRTARALGDLHSRLEAIDKAQTKIEKLSGDVLSLQDILSNKQTRGAFGEIQLHDIVAKALPPDAYSIQATLSNGRRADCLVHLPMPPGPIAIDSKFPLEAYESLRAAATETELKRAAQELRRAVSVHLEAIAERYIIEEETADSALLFLPSEAVYAELHANFAELVRQGFERRVWIVSPTTLMAVLNTMRGVMKDARMRKEAARIRRELGLLHKDLGRLGDRVGNLDRHFAQAAQDIEQIKISAEKAGNRAQRLEAFDFEEPDPAALSGPGGDAEPADGRRVG